MTKKVEDILQFCQEKGVRMIDFKTVDLTGRWHHVTLPVERFNEDTVKYGIGFDGSNFGYASVEKSDMVFVPDLDTACLEPFAAAPTLSMTGDVQIIDQPENRRFGQYARSVTQRAEEYMRETGIADTMVVGPEFEFYVFDRVSFENAPHRASFRVDCAEADWTAADPDSLGYQTAHHDGYHAALPQDVTFDLRNDICMKMADWGVQVKYHHHEVGGPGQLEVEVEPESLTEMADKTMITKYLIKNCAIRAGKTATFMPKPLHGEAGSGMHVHIWLWKDGKPLFYDEKGYSQLSDTALWFIGGLLKHAGSLCAITNPSTNSFKRLVPGFEAPVTIGYATANRSSIIRIPAYAKTPAQKRFELRNPDATCNPYYAYAAILMAGLDGILNKIDPHENGWGPYDFNLFKLSDEDKARIQGLPKSLGEALDALEADHGYLTAGGVFPEELIRNWIKLKRAEEEEISKIPTSVEFQKYYTL
ncbi:MAG: type I glutamate--ammonia ligase [Oscillospiraceae bacterium]|jgi:glutamine synthetase|nr:type I glutamate--ammonia ligase [Oscillospiraceae bacterium]